MYSDSELIKARRTEPWRTALRQQLSNKERIQLIPQSMAELHQAPEPRALYIEDKLGFTPEEALMEARRCLDCPTPGCVEACPAHIHIPSFIKHIEAGELSDAWHILRERSTLSAICSRVCAHDEQCQGGCIYPVSLKRRAVAIGALERYVATYEEAHRGQIGSLATPKPDTGHRVAIIGAGPSGMSAAHDLALMGHKVDLYEAEEYPGGVMRMGIPRFRLPSEVIDDEIARLEHYGVSIHYGVRIGRDLSLEELRSRGYDAIYLATGACLSNLMEIPGEDLSGVIKADEYLYTPNMGGPSTVASWLGDTIPQRVAIIGGGNTAMDAARTARRLGAAEVMVVYRRGMEEMPACRDEVEHALAEGVEFLTLHQVKQYHADQSGKLVSMELIEMTLGEPDESGRRRPEPTGRLRTEPIDQAVVCVGVMPDRAFTEGIPGLDTHWGGVAIVDDGQRTSLDWLFAGGDASRGGSTVVHAMADGRRAAQSIDAYLTSLHTS